MKGKRAVRTFGLMNFPRRPAISTGLTEDIARRLQTFSATCEPDVNNPRNAVVGPLVTQFLVLRRLLVRRLRVERRVIRRWALLRRGRIAVMLGLALLGATTTVGRIHSALECLKVFAKRFEELVERRVHFREVTLELQRFRIRKIQHKTANAIIQ